MKNVISIIILLLLLTGCGTKNNNSMNEKNNNQVNDNSNEDIKLYSDDSKIVFKQSNNSYLVFYYEEDKITGYELYLNYEDSSTASVAYNVLKDNHSAYNNVKNIYQNGKYVVIEFNEEEYNAYSLEDVKRVYEKLEQVQK